MVDKTSYTMKKFGQHIKRVGDEVDEEAVREMIDIILNAEKSFVVGAGRSGLVAKMFGMRLMHLGINVFVVGETITPSLEEEDAVIAISGSGETSSTIDISKTTVENNASLIGITGSSDSTLASIADCVVTISDKFEKDVNQEEIAPLGTLFELTSAALMDSIISEMMAIMGKNKKDLEEKHATLE
ncbi:6-phospho-3-hexuloisomerase [archaeon SCG-AAA382B04]|nr:6-phospho-3-hexuloisomerase [archaeon SCG-AAA382B04]